MREIARALAAGVELVELYFFPGLCDDPEHQELLARAGQGRGVLIEVPPHVIEKLSFGQRVEGVVAVARQPERSLADLSLPPDSLIAVIEGIEKPGNLGAILRTADAAGVAAVIVAGGGTDLYNPNAIRASLGAIFTVPVCAAPSPAVLDWLRANGYRMLAARVDGASDYAAADYCGPRALVLGSEAHGLAPEVLALVDQPVSIPMAGRSESLNVAMAGSVLCFEALRQRRRADTPEPIGEPPA